MLAAQLPISNVDLAIVVAYFVLIVGLGCFVGLRRRQAGAAGKDYFLAGRNLTWPIIGLALFSTNISTIHLVGQAQAGYKSGLVYGNFEWMAPFTLIALALFFAPFYIRSRVATLPDFLEKRYSRASRNWLAALSMVSAVFVHIGFSLYTGAVVLEGLFGIDRMTSVIGICLLTGLYTVVGGLLAVVLTESIQTIILLAGAICITAFGLHRVGGWSGLTASVDPAMLTMIRSAKECPELPWYAVFLGYPVIGLWYWCADQTIVQRVLGARSENHARVGPLFAGFIKILPVFIFVLPGTIGLALVNQGKLPALRLARSATVQTTPVVLSQTQQDVLAAVKAAGEGKEAGTSVEQVAGSTGLSSAEVSTTAGELVAKDLIRVRSEDIYAHMIVGLLPVGLKGIVAAALLAALMSTVSGALNSIATLFCYDIYRQWRPDTPDRSLVRMGQVVTVVAMVTAILWTPLIKHFPSIYDGVNTLICFIAPPITAVFVWGVFWRRASSAGALATLIIGSALGFVVFWLEWFKDSTKWNVHYMMAGFYLFVICSVVMCLVSTLRPDPPSDERAALCWGNPLAALRGDAWRGVGNFRLLAALLFVTMIAMYVIFA